jgi:hypothetical protein
VRVAARALAQIASHLEALQGDTNAYLTDPNYGTYHLIRAAAAT